MPPGAKGKAAHCGWWVTYSAVKAAIRTKCFKRIGDIGFGGKTVCNARARNLEKEQPVWLLALQQPVVGTPPAVPRGLAFLLEDPPAHSVTPYVTILHDFSTSLQTYVYVYCELDQTPKAAELKVPRNAGKILKVAVWP
jgi:hypothetical protein